MRTPIVTIRRLAGGRVRATARIGGPPEPAGPMTHVWHCPVCGDVSPVTPFGNSRLCAGGAWLTRVHDPVAMVLRRLAPR